MRIHQKLLHLDSGSWNFRFDKYHNKNKNFMRHMRRDDLSMIL